MNKTKDLLEVYFKLRRDMVKMEDQCENLIDILNDDARGECDLDWEVKVL